MRRGLVVLGTAAGAALSSCMDATDVQLIQIEAAGVVAGLAYLDLNGNGSRDAADAPLQNVRVVLASPDTVDTLYEATTDAAGAFLFRDVVVGAYDLGFDPGVLSDSLVAVGDAAGPLTITFGDTVLVALGASFPELTLEEVRATEPGRRVFTAGIALNARLNPDPTGQIHFQDPSSYLRTLNVERGNLFAGDSVRLLGRTGVSNGQPVLDMVTPFVLVQLAAVPARVEVSTQRAATADGGPLDAALVRIRRAEITDTSTVSGDFHFWADDGSGEVEVVLRSFLGANTSLFRPDTIVRIQEATGLLTPYEDGGALRWRFLPRAASEVLIEAKFANVGVTTSFDPVQAAQDDTVEIRVVVSNAGPQTATGVAVADTIQAGLAFVSASATTGSYDEASSRWDVGDVVAGASETLIIRVAVTTGTPGQVQNRARFLGLAREVDPSAANDNAAASLTIS